MPTRIHLLLALVATPALSETSPLQVSDFLPLSVGNSWTYDFYYNDPRRDPDGPQYGQVTISILRTEVIDGNTCYVFSDIPTGVPVAPVHSIADKKLRWEGNSLMQHDGVSEYSIFRFQDIPTLVPPQSHARTETEHYVLDPTKAHGDTLGTVFTSSHRVQVAAFAFFGHTDSDTPEARSERAGVFLRNFGMTSCYDALSTSPHYADVMSRFRSVTARLLVEGTTSGESGPRDGSYVEISYWDAVWGRFPDSTTDSNSSSWGRVKAGASR